MWLGLSSGDKTRPGLGTVLSSSVMQHSGHQGAVATQNPGGRDSPGPASLWTHVGCGHGLQVPPIAEAVS